MSKNPKLKDRSDREILELIISNQANMAQIYRINSFFCDHYGDEYIKKIKHKLPALNKLLEEEEDLLMQIRAEIARED